MSVHAVLNQEEQNVRAQTRKELCLTELLGETVKLRGMGYKTMRKAVIRAQPGRSASEQYRPIFKYEKEPRQQAVELIKRLDVMTPDGWATVWDDGAEDLYGEELASSAKPTGRKYMTGML